MPEIIEHIAFFAGGISLLVAVGQLCVQYRRLENYNLFALFFVLSLLLFQYGFIFNGVVLQKPFLLYFHFTLLYCLGPVLYYAYYLVIRVDESLPKKKLWLLAPAALYLIGDIYFIRSDVAVQKDIITSLFIDYNRLNTNAWGPFLVCTALLLDSLYIILLVKRIFQYWRLRELTPIMVITLIFSFVSIAGLLLLSGSYYYNNQLFMKISILIMACLLIAAYLVGQHRPEFLQLLVNETRKKRYERSLLKGLEIDKLCSKLKQLMKEERLYLDEDITIKQVADELHLTVHQLSELLNVKLMMNFNTFINLYRIQEAKQMLIDEPDRSVLSIAYAVGFNSKSSFYEAFTRFTGKTPVQYRKYKLLKMQEEECVDKTKIMS